MGRGADTTNTNEDAVVGKLIVVVARFLSLCVVFLAVPDVAAAQGTLIAPFVNGPNGVTTTNSYSGSVSINVSGFGQAAESKYSDAFYIFTDNSGNPITPEHHFDFGLCINFQPVDTYLETIPPFRSDHTYQFTISVGSSPQQITFGVCDTFTADNSGSYTITVRGTSQSKNLPANALLPFQGTKNYTGGPHVSDDTDICEEKSLSAADGIDFAATEEDQDRHFEVLSISSGTLVEAVEWDGTTIGKGTYVAIRHDNGLTSEYWHLSRLSDEIKALRTVGSNQKLKRGFPLGFAGDSGFQDSIHLHLRIVGATWQGQSINGYQIWMHRKPGSDSIGFNYQGSATKGRTKNHNITLSASACDGAQASAKVGRGFTGTEERNGVDPNTLFAEESRGLPQAPMVSKNRRSK